MKERKVIRYSESFKMRVVREVEEGRFANGFAAGRHYGIGSEMTVNRWLKKFGKSGLLAKVVRVETPDEQSELKRLRERVRQLEKAVADQFIAGEVEKSYLEIACERAGFENVEEFKKKASGSRRGGRLSAMEERRQL